MTARRVLFLLGAVALLGRGPAARAAAEGAWTRERVLALVFRINDLMSHLTSQQMDTRHPLRGTCGGSEIMDGIEKSVVMPQIRALVTGDAVTSYLASYLGCDAGDWLVSGTLVSMPRAFTRSRVTIVEQTADRVVADVTESYYPEQDLGNHVAVTSDGDDDDERLLTQAEVDAVKDFSRYTITRGKDGVWRISDRKPSFPLPTKLVNIDLSPRPRTRLAPLRKPASGKDWTADQLLAFVIRTDLQMRAIYAGEDSLDLDTPVTCHGAPIARAIEKARVLSQMRSFVSARLVDCYVATYVGCEAGKWVGAPFASFVGPGARPFTLSKVTIVEQTSDRVVADISEAPSDVVDDQGVLFVQDTGEPDTNTTVQGVSRYTITREKDGVWRISDRKSNDESYCPSPNRPA